MESPPLLQKASGGELKVQAKGLPLADPRGLGRKHFHWQGWDSLLSVEEAAGKLESE